MEWHFDIHYQPVGKGGEEVIARATFDQHPRRAGGQAGPSRRLVGLLLATVLTGVVVGSLLLMQLLVKRPVQRLGQFAKRVASGELGAQVDVVSRDEIGDLTRQFNAMSQTLHAAHAELATSEARYRSLFQNASEGIFVADHLGRVVRINHALVDLLGLPRVVSPPSLSAWPTCFAPRPPGAWKNASAARARCVSCRWNCAGPMAPGASLS